MCGFLGEYSYNNSLSDADVFKELLALSKHRGPDATNISTGRNYTLGFNRLALLDLSTAGEQPRKSPSQRYHLVFNGEVYNYKELIAQHQLENLDSTSDTEVILHLLDLLGIEETLKSLNGMLALAIIDTLENELYLSRDFAGIKPLFYGINASGVVFASQFDQVFKHPWFSEQLSLRPEIIHEYFAFGYMAAPNTVYKKIFQLRPGELLRINSQGEILQETILHFPKETDLREYDLKSLKTDLKKAVSLQLNSHRSLATFLSGGIDSSLVSAYAKEEKENIQAFTLKVNDKALNETKYAQSYAQHLNLSYEIVEADTDSLLAVIDEHFQAFSEPFGDYSSIPTYMVTKKASQRHTSMLSGDGGDELFWGYTRMFELLEKADWFKLPLPLRKNILRITNRLKITNTYAPYKKDLQTYWQDWHIKIPMEVLNQAFKDEFSQEMKELYSMDKTYSKKQVQHFLRWNEFYGHLQRILIKVDRTSMKNSLEIRVPLLDKNVIKNSWSIYFPIRTLMELKKPLKRLLQEKIPDALIMKEKKGFSVPIESWLRNELKADLINTVLNKDLYGHSCFDQTRLKDYVSEFLDEKHDDGWGIWHIYAWQKWAANFLEKA